MSSSIKIGASRLVSEDPTKIILIITWFPAHSSHVYISVTTNSVEKYNFRSLKLQLGVYVSVNWKIIPKIREILSI